MIASNSAVVHGFQVFYYELLRQKEKALSFYLKADVVPTTESNESSYNSAESSMATPEFCVESSDTYGPDITELHVLNDELEGAIVAIQGRLIRSINSVGELILAKSHLSEQFVNDVRYVLAILSDEIFLNINWDGSERWKLYLLEKQLFQSEIAGNKFFEMAEETITSTRDEEMAFLLLTSLSLGFKGKFRDAEKANDHISTYKSRLYSIVHPQYDRLFYPGRIHLIESCYDYTCVGGLGLDLPDTKYWFTCIVSVLITYVIVSYFVWYNITDDINILINQIKVQIRSCPVV